MSGASVDILFIDYQCLRIYLGSLGIQALVEGMSKDTNQDTQAAAQVGGRSSNALVSEVTEASSAILSKSIALARAKILRFCPARTLSRITSACIFLLKALGLSKSGGESFTSLNVLDECLEVLSE